jgi:hypothetical protein
VLKVIDNPEAIHLNRAALKGKSTVWLLGDDAVKPDWINMLQQIGITASDISQIDFGYSFVDREGA